MTPARMAAIHAAAMTTSRAWNETEFRDLLADRTVFPVAAEAGFALGRAVADEAELLTIAVAPQAQRTGVGARLLAAFETGARARHADAAFLEVAEDNAPARALYAKGGWIEVGRRTDYYSRRGAPAVTGLILRKPLR